jgi:hypothetical protein
MAVRPYFYAKKGENTTILGGTPTFNFGEAIKYLKRGFRVCRQGWNGKSQYVELASNISYKSAKGDIVNCEHECIGNKAIAFVGTSGVQMGWLASQADMLAEDWMFAEWEVKMDRQEVINIFAQEMAKTQKKADKFYYKQDNKDMAAYCTDHALVIKNLAIKLGICEEVYQEAYKIYDFRNSGKTGYTLKDGKIVIIKEANNG